MKEGWICPRCGKVNAPFVDQCSCNDSECHYHSNGLCDHMWRIQSLNADKNSRYRFKCRKCGKTIWSMENPNFDF